MTIKDKAQMPKLKYQMNVKIKNPNEKPK